MNHIPLAPYLAYADHHLIERKAVYTVPLHVDLDDDWRQESAAAPDIAPAQKENSP